MSFYELLRISLITLKSHKLRSLLTTLGVMIGVMTVIGMLALINGLNKVVTGQLASIGTNTLYIQKHPWVFNRDEQIEARKWPNLTMNDLFTIDQQISGIQRIAPLLMSTANVRHENKILNSVDIIGTTSDYLYIADFTIDSGRQITPVDMSYNRKVIMIGATLAKELFATPHPLGQTVDINGTLFEVIATLAPKGQLFGSDQDNTGIIPVSTYIQQISGPIRRRGEESVTIVVEPDDPSAIDELKRNITTLLRRERKLNPGEKDNFSINTADQLMKTYQTITSGVFGLMIGVTTLSLIVGGIGIMNIMLVAVTERIREIGIRRAIGARKKDILSQFLLESIVLSTFGGIIGMILGFTIAKGVSIIINLPAAVTWWSIFLGFTFSFFVGVFFGWYPARKAASLNPIDALRHE
jgi:putative ABC transport system permease protein